MTFIHRNTLRIHRVPWEGSGSSKVYEEGVQKIKTNLTTSGNEFWYEKVEGKKGKNGKQVEQVFSMRKVKINGEKDV